MYIFLDVDGVLNTKDDWNRKMYSLNENCIRIFCDLVENLDNPKIVLSSTWRNGIARDGTTAVHINDLIKAISKTGITELDRTVVALDGSRSKEIDYFLRRHAKDEYIILDDDLELFDDKERTPNLFLIDASVGITKNDVKRILKSVR